MIPRVSAAAAAALRAAALPLGRCRITPRLATRLLSPLGHSAAPAPAPATPRSNSTSASPSRTRDIVAQAVASIGSRREGQQYLKYFTSVSSQRFAVIKVGGAILTDHLDELCRSVAFLYELGLYPVLVHGGGPQLNRLLEAAGVEPQFEEGIRVTDAATLRVAYDLFARENGRLVARLDELGVMTRPLLYGVLEAEYLDRDRWGYVGRVTRVRRESVEGAIDAGYVPILASLAATADGQLLNINADVAAAELARALEPLKVVYLSERGGLFNDETGRIISRIELDEEYDHLMRQPWCRYGTRLKLREIKDLLDTLPRSSSVAIIHPSQIQRELFTDSGAGTMILRGDRVKVADSLDGFSDLARLREALRRDHPSVEAAAAADGTEEEARIDRCLRRLATEPFRAYFDESLHCLGIVTPSPHHPAADRTGIATLTTLAVTRHGWISNAAENVFAAIRKDFPRLVFSVGADDENLPWFFSRSSGSLAGPTRRRVFFWWGAGHTDPDLLAAWEAFVKEEREAASSPSSPEGSGQQAPARPPPPPAWPALQQQPPPPQQQQVRTFSTTSARSRPQSPVADISDHSRYYSAKLRSPNPNPPLDKSNATNSRPSRVALLGARGYTGRALIDLINTHPHFNLTHVSSRELAGQPLDCYTRHELTYVNLRTDDVTRMEREGVIDCWVLALPNGVCGAYVAALEEARSSMPPSAQASVVVDLSADYRFDSGWTYGLPELTPRPAIASSRFISNPGCYATAAQLGIAPLVAFLGGEPTVFGVSGYSGAGTKPSAKNDIELLRDNLIPYSLADHVHEREMSRHLGASVAFCPHVASWFRGIHNTISIPLCQPMTSRDIRQMYQDRYAGERLVKVVGEAPLVKAIMGRHGVEIGGFAVHSSGKRVIVCTTIDNLFKGAATQCLQNMNLALGYAEYEGIPTM